MDFTALAQQCAPAVHPQTMAAVAHVESSFNPFAIGVVGGRLERQPSNKAEAVVTAKALEEAGFNFSVGVGQVNRYNLRKYGLDYEKAFDACPNLRAASLILKDCYDRARAQRVLASDQDALQASFSCYYSGNFSAGFKPDFKGQPSYVQKVLKGAGVAGAVQAVAPIRWTATSKTKAAPRARDEGAFRLTVEAADNGQAPAAASVYGTTSESVMVFR